MPIDGSIVGLYLLVTMIAGLAVRKYVSRVEDFLVAGREMNVYLGIASLAATEFGVITCMYTAQAGYTAGFSGSLPGIVQAVSMFLIGITGFCVNPLRKSGAMTLPELFEKRYGKFVRWLSGVVIILGGLLNMGVFLKITGDFLCLVCGIHIQYLVLMMTGLLVLGTIYTVLGGMISVLVTDFLQFIVMSAGLLVVTLLILYTGSGVNENAHIGWQKIVDTVEKYHKAGGFNPFANGANGWAFFLNQVITITAANLTWQTSITRLLAAKDAKTGRQIYTRTSFFFVCRWLIPGMWGIAALAYLGWHPLKQLVEMKQVTQTELAAIPAPVQEKIENSALNAPLKDLTPEEMAAIPLPLQNKLNDVSLNSMPYFLSLFLPVGFMGLLVAAMLAADMSSTSSYMLVWSSVIYNDILAPFRKGKWSDKRAILWNRFIVALIGVYLFVFGLLYHPEGNIWSFLLLTGSIYLSSMSVLLIACCYWRKANDWGALGAIIVGAALPLTHLTLEKIDATKAFALSIGKDYVGIATFVLAGVAMVIGSLLKQQKATAQADMP